MVQPYPLPRGIRQTAVLVGDDASTIFGPFAFSIFDVEDVIVWIKAAGEPFFTIADAAVAKTSDAPFSPFTVEFETILPSTTEFVVQGRRVAERSSDVTKGIGLDSLALEKELSKHAQVLQELRRDLNTSVRIPFGFLEPLVEAPQDGRALMWELDGLLPRVVNGPNADEIENAQTYATAALEQADRAEGIFNDISELLTEGNAQVVRLTGDGVTTSFTLPIADLSELSTPVYIDGIYQQTDAFAIAGTSLIFSEAPPAPEDGLTPNIEVRIQPTIVSLIDGLSPSKNLQDLTNIIAARANLGLGSAATLERVNVGLTVNIPTDYDTLQEAIEALRDRIVEPSYSIALNIEAAHALTAGLLLEDGDYSKFRIIAEDAEVGLAAAFAGHVIRGINAKMPTLGCLIDASNQTSGDGVYLTGPCTMFVEPGCGVKNTWSNGILARGGGQVYAQSTIWTGCARNNATGAGITAWGAYIDATSADASGSNYYGAQAAHGGILGFEFGNADDCFRYGVRATDAGIMDFSEGHASNCGLYGIYAFQNSHMNAPDAVANNCGTANAAIVNGSTGNLRRADLRSGDQDGLQVLYSAADAFDAQFDNCVRYGLHAEAARVGAGAASASGCARGFYVTQCSTVTGSAAVANACSDTGFYAERGSILDVKTGSATGCGSFGVLANESATINAQSGTFTGGGTGGVRALNGSRLDASNANCRKGGADDTGTNTADIQTFSGSLVTAIGATGGANRAINAITANGIIFR